MIGTILSPCGRRRGGAAVRRLCRQRCGSLPAHTTSYHHPDLIPETPFFYRERPFTGPVSTDLRAVTDPDVTTCALALLPGEQRSAFRIGTLHYGPLFPVVHRTTGKER
ncbi:hypothetical protein [Amycolatopsis sp. lyj-23]|uniref:hypothetical protein n=1 Tax=Amycolatopsis sp. lyj-23 TaxID=2789283 RepID=UPI00397896F9